MTLTPIQMLMLGLAALCYAAGGVGAAMQLAGKQVRISFRMSCIAAGLALSLLLLAWHARATGNWQPLQDNFSALLTLAVLLAGFAAYFQIHRPMASLVALCMPVVVVLLLMAGYFGRSQPGAYLITWYSLGHRVAAFLGILAFVVAGASGVLYLLSDHMLRLRWSGRQGKLRTPPSPEVFGSLERLERLTFASVVLGFALFTLGILIGIGWVLHYHSTRMGAHWYLTPKVLLSFAAWIIFAIVLHTPIAPRLRGRKTAILSICGLVLSLATLLAVLLMPKGGQ